MNYVKEWYGQALIFNSGYPEIVN